MAPDHHDPLPRPDHSRPERAYRRASGWSLDRILLIALIGAGLGFSAVLLRGFEPAPSREYDPMTMYQAYYDAEQIQIDVNRASREELLLIPMVSERIADGIIEARPFKLSEELLNVKGIGEVNLEIIRMYFYGFEDVPAPRIRRPLGVPDV